MVGNFHIFAFMQDINHKLPSECTSLSEVRGEIDNIDRAIIKLLGERSGYVKEVTRYKEKTAASVEAPERRMQMLCDRRRWAADAGLSPDVVEEIFDRLVRYFIEEEKKLMNI